MFIDLSSNAAMKLIVRAMPGGGGGGVLPIMAYTGRLRPKGVPFSRFRYMKGQGFHESKYMKG